MNESTVTITIKGVPHYFNGNELISPIEEAILFLKEQSLKEEIF